MDRREAFRFDAFTLEVTERRLLCDAEPVRLSPKAFDILITLVREQGRLVTKDELLARVWPDSYVEEGILTVHIAALRKALGDDTRHARYIETVARSGYRFIAPVTPAVAAATALPRPVELYEFVGRGRSHLLSASYFELSEAMAAFSAAIQIDSTYAPAHAGLALVRCAQAGLRAAPHQEAFAEAKASALRALAMDSACADAQVALGAVLFLSEWDWPAAERSLRRALAINPAHTEALLQYGALMEALGKPVDGLQFKQQALERDPRSAMVLVQIAMNYWHQRKYPETLIWARRALEIDPKHLLAGEFIAGVYWKLDDVDRFVAENLRRATVFGASAAALSDLQRVCTRMQQAHATSGAPGLAQCMADHIASRASGSTPQLSVQRAILCGVAGRLDEAFQHLDAALAVRDPALVHLAVAPQWDSLRGDRRFDERLDRMKLQ